MTIKIKVGSLLLSAARDVDLPQEFAAWHQTVRIPPGTYDVFAYLDPEGTAYRVCQLSAQCAGTTVSSNFRSHMLGTWGKRDNNRDGQPATAHIHLPTSGLVNEPRPSLLSQATLCDALVRDEWEPREIDPRSTSERRWRLIWNQERSLVIIERARHGGGLDLAVFEDHRRFRVDDDEMAPGEAAKLDVWLQHPHSLDQLTIGETAIGWSFSLRRSRQITRLA